MNWVERRYKSEANMKNGAPLLWGEVRAAIEDAVASFNEHYQQGGHVTCESKNGLRMIVSMTALVDNVTRTVTVEAVFDPGGPSKNAKLSSIYYGRKPITELKFLSDENDVRIVFQNTYVTPDEASKIILEPFLFPKVPPSVGLD